MAAIVEKDWSGPAAGRETLIPYNFLLSTNKNRKNASNSGITCETFRKGRIREMNISL